MSVDNTMLMSSAFIFQSLKIIIVIEHLNYFQSVVALVTVLSMVVSKHVKLIQAEIK